MRAKVDGDKWVHDKDVSKDDIKSFFNGGRKGESKNKNNEAEESYPIDSKEDIEQRKKFHKKALEQANRALAEAGRRI